MLMTPKHVRISSNSLKQPLNSIQASFCWPRFFYDVQGKITSVIESHKFQDLLLCCMWMRVPFLDKVSVYYYQALVGESSSIGANSPETPGTVPDLENLSRVSPRNEIFLDCPGMPWILKQLKEGHWTSSNVEKCIWALASETEHWAMSFLIVYVHTDELIKQCGYMLHYIYTSKFA